MRRTGKAECLSFIFYTENYGRGKVTTKPDGSLLDEPIIYPANRDELIMRVQSEFSPHGIMIGLHDDDAPNKDHEHWYLGFENNRMQPNDFEPIAHSMGFVVKPSEAYMNRPDTLEDYLTHTSDAATKDGKKTYDASHIWKSPYWDASLYMSSDAKRDIKREQRMDGNVEMDMEIINYIETFNIRYFPELLHFLQKYHHQGLYAYVLMNRATFYGMYLREMREAERFSYTPGYVQQECKKNYPHGTNSVDAGKNPPKNDNVPDPGCLKSEIFNIIQNVGLIIDDEMYNRFYEVNEYWLTNNSLDEHFADIVLAKYRSQIATQGCDTPPPAEGVSREAREADTSETPGINESDIADADFASDDFESFNPDDDDPFHAELDTIDQAWDLGFIASSDGDNPFE